MQHISALILRADRTIFSPFMKRTRRKLNRIKEALKSQGKSQVWLSEKLDIDFGTVNRWANNSTQPSLETLFDIAYALKISARELITE